MRDSVVSAGSQIEETPAKGGLNDPALQSSRVEGGNPYNSATGLKPIDEESKQVEGDEVKADEIQIEVEPAAPPKVKQPPAVEVVQVDEEQ